MKTFIIILLISASVFAQSNPDQTLISFNNATDVNDALVKAAGAISGTGVANQIAYWTGTSKLGSLATNTYPSLIELARVKGVNAPIQTQLNGKQATLVSGANIKTINNQSLLGSGNIVITSDTTGLWLKIYNEIQRQLTGNAINGTKATLDSMITDFRKNNYIRLNK